MVEYFLGTNTISATYEDEKSFNHSNQEPIQFSLPREWAIYGKDVLRWHNLQQTEILINKCKQNCNERLPSPGK